MPFGIGFRPRYFGDLVDRRPPVDWLEILSENFMGIGGRTRQMLLRLRADYPLVLHGVSLSIAGPDPLDAGHLARLKALADEVEPRFVTDHLAWTSWRGRESHDLLPVAYTAAVLGHVARRVAQVQDRLGRRLYLENPSVYVAFAGDEMDEADFLAELCRRSGCGVLLDVNNLMVNAGNLGWDPAPYLERLDPADVAYLHVAGHRVLPDVRVDTHDEPVPDPVWALYGHACARFPDAGTVLERDGAFPPFAELMAELARARALHAAAGGEAGLPAPMSPVRRGGAGREWAEVQETFFAGVVGAAAADDAAALLAPTAPVPPARGLAVYREAFMARLCRGLGQNFPTLRRVIGAAEWEALVAAYVAAWPPRGYEFSRVTAQLAAHVSTHRFDADFGVPVAVLADLAAFEQAELEVADAPDDGPPLPAAALAEVPPERWPGLRARCASALRVVRCTSDVLPVMEAVAAGRAPERPVTVATTYLVCRPAADVVWVRVGDAEADVVERLCAGDTIETACAGRGMETGAGAVVRLASLGLLRGLA